MKLVTFNIRLDCGNDGANNFIHRRDMILEVIDREQPDILCFQEVLPHVAVWLREKLARFCVVGCPRGPELEDEQCCIAFRPDLYELLRMESYWLSPTPMVPGSRYAVQSICPRVCTELTLRELGSGTVFRLSNTHLDHEGHPARCLAAKQIIRKDAEQQFLPGIPSILVGDMNAEPEDPEILLLSDHYENHTRDIGFTFHGFGQYNPVQIDYIFTRGGIRCSQVSKWEDCRNGVWLSDHYPVCAELEL